VVDILMDTNIIVDLLRGYQPARDWIAAQKQIGICRGGYMEVIQGAADKKKQREVLKFLKRFTIIEHTQADFIWATRQLIRHSLAYSVDVTDALIAAPAYRLQKALYTRNSKHFIPMIPALVQQPY
jgi:predicted nucleic acid-binding protein